MGQALSEILGQTDSTCTSCKESFQSPVLQRQHYESAWHNYNLKRNAAELPPVTAEEFEMREDKQKNEEKILTQTKRVCCSSCQEFFIKKSAIERNMYRVSMVTRTKCAYGVEGCGGLPIYANDDAESKTEWEDFMIENPIDNDDCIFCLHHSNNLKKNLKHMATVHCFFIPDIEYCADVEGLLRYLGEKISKEFMCIWCNGKTFYSADSARQHMLDKGHCKMIYESTDLAEYMSFYDYSSLFNSDSKDDINSDEWVSVNDSDSSEYELVLPSGVTVGHRSLKRYYNQMLHPNRAVAVVDEADVAEIKSDAKKLHKAQNKLLVSTRKARDTHSRMHSRNKLKMVGKDEWSGTRRLQKSRSMSRN